MPSATESPERSSKTTAHISSAQVKEMSAAAWPDFESTRSVGEKTRARILGSEALDATIGLEVAKDNRGLPQFGEAYSLGDDPNNFGVKIRDPKEKEKAVAEYWADWERPASRSTETEERAAEVAEEEPLSPETESLLEVAGNMAKEVKKEIEPLIDLIVAKERVFSELSTIRRELVNSLRQGQTMGEYEQSHWKQKADIYVEEYERTTLSRAQSSDIDSRNVLEDALAKVQKMSREVDNFKEKPEYAEGNTMSTEGTKELQKRLDTLVWSINTISNIGY